MWKKARALAVAFVFAGAMTLSAFAQQNANSKGQGYKPDGNAQHATSPATQQAEENRISREVRHQILMLPYYSVFDDLGYRVDGNTVTLVGAVADPVVKGDAEAAVKHIEGVEQVNNQIKVLPPSPMDDQIRRAEFRAIYSTPQLQKYGWYAVQGIHIIVQNGHVTLMGTVDSEADKNMAALRANTVPNVFSVNNELQVGSGKQEARK